MLLLVVLVLRFRRKLLTRAEVLMVLPLIFTSVAAALQPRWFDIVLIPLGLHPGGQRRLVGVLVFSVIFLVLLVLWIFMKLDTLSRELANNVDRAALRRFQQEHPSALSGQCAVIIPSFNEAQNLPGVLRNMPQSVGGIPVQAVVVADGCTDGTEAVARSMGALVIERDIRRGQGAGIRLGYLAALRNEAQVLLTMDADGQHDPKEMHTLVAPLLDGRAEMVQGSRVLGSSNVESISRATGVKLFARVLTRISKTKITDPSNGYRAVLPQVLARLDLRQDQFFVSELIVDALHKGVRLVEVPITVHRREHGTSKKGGTLRYGWGFTRTLGLTWLRQRIRQGPDLIHPRWLADHEMRVETFNPVPMTEPMLPRDRVSSSMSPEDRL